MLSFFNRFRDITTGSVIIRMILSCLCGALVGIERSYHNRAAGFRTHMLVCVGASIASLTGIFLYVKLLLPADISRIGASIITGLGFIGAGTIFISGKDTVKGLTTAAGMWTSGIIGLSIGAGFYEGGLLGTFLVLMAETFFFGLLKNVGQLEDFKMVVHFTDTEALDTTMRYLKDLKMRVKNLQIEAEEDEEGMVYSAILSIRPYKKVDMEQVAAHICAIPRVLGAHQFD